MRASSSENAFIARASYRDSSPYVDPPGSGVATASPVNVRRWKF